MSLFARGITRQNVVAIAVGVLVACAPLVVFNFWLSGVTDRIGQEEIELSARNAIVRAEARLRLVSGALDVLAAVGVGACDTAERTAMQRATFETSPIKEISIIDSAGRSVCPQTADVAADTAIRRVYSSELLPGNQGYAIDVLSVGTADQRMIRLRRPLPNGGNEIAALVPTTLLLPQYAVELTDAHAAGAFGDAGAATHGRGIYARLETRNRTVL